MKGEVERAAMRAPRTLRVESPAFRPGASIPRRHTCHGDEASPALRVDGVPAEAVALALVVDDPDAPGGTWTHWTAWDLPPSTTEVEESADLSRLGVEGTTSAREAGYHGPCPPRGTHRYFFRFFALRQKLGLPRGASAAEVWRALDEHTLAWGELMGTFTKP